MKKKKIILSVIGITLIIPPLLYFFTPEIDVYHPFETIYSDKENNIIYSSIKSKEGNYISYEQIPEEFITYLITIEDKNFFSHKGFDFFRIISSFIHNLGNNESIQGASTITMQLARLLYLSQEKSYSRKIQELFLAIKLENNLTKEEILEYYLNSVYFAHGIYGIGNASFYYFSKDINELNLYEYALLIAIINAPSLYSPYIDKEASFNKTKSILKTLYKKDKITIHQYYQAIYNENVINPQKEIKEKKYPYYIDSVNEELEKLNISSLSITHGIQVKTFLNIEIQNYIDSLISKYNFSSSDVGIVIMEANSGKVISLVGGKDYKISKFNRVMHAKKQIGSTIKPFLYYCALEKGLSPLTEFTSKETTFKLNSGEYYKVSNASSIYANRKISMIEAIAMSDNIYAMKTLLLIGENKLINLINSAGFEVDVNNVTIALGSNSLTPLELTSLYNAIASNGSYYKPKLIESVQKEDSSYLYKYSNNSVKLLTNKNTTILQYLLRAPFDQALKSYASPSLMNYYISPSYAGKTGSTDSSSWVIGFSNKYTIGVYVGSDDNSRISNGYLSKEIFQKIALFLDEKKGTFFPVPYNLKSFSLINKTNNKRSFTYVY